MTHRKHGFTLIELAIALTVIGLIMGLGASALKRMGEESREKITEQKMDAVEDALILYATRNGHLPCPADGNLVDGHTRAGRGMPTGATKNCNEQTAGVVPWLDLGLSADDTLDGWSRRITYRVYDGPEGMTKDGGVNMSDCDPTADAIAPIIPDDIDKDHPWHHR
ncbi:MAG: prepilin-type N-terminal cleavage/methylation domain-containing protein, partial [Pseudomonadota bacterium]|nr:prepilin-type N-terminal cleavage/methylation domain-containing protein [Pseudomonadota bacterium]